MRNNTLSAAVRNGYLNRESALLEYKNPPSPDEDLVSYFKKRLEISDAKYEEVMNSPIKNWTNYPTYKKHFEFLRPLFFLLAESNLVPKSFYLKYCFPAKAPE